MRASEGPEGSKFKRRIRAWLPWLSLFALPLLFELPAVLTSTVVDPSALRLSLELPLVLTVWLATLGMARRAIARIALSAIAIILVVYRFDQWVCWTLLRDEPLLYDQLFMLRHLWALIGDLMSARTLLVLLAVLLGAVALVWLVRLLLRRARVLGLTHTRRTWGILALVWCLLLVARSAQLASEDPHVLWLSPQIARNVRSSVRTYRGVQKRLKKSPYSAYRGLSLRDKPDVLLFIVESYGRLLSVEEKTRTRHAALLAELEVELGRAGFQAASAFATATVSGGRSWIAEGTILMGTPIRYEAAFQHIVAQKPPSFVSFLNQNGYETALLAPADRDRAGFHPENRYAFTRVFSYRELDYRGPAIGWGLVPDQYSLAFIERALLKPAQRPVFLDFHMVSSHAPWSQVPRFEDDPARLLTDTRSANEEQPGGGDDLALPFHRYSRGSGRYAYMRHFDDAMREGYQSTVEYDLRAIAQYLGRRDKDAFVIVLGDHQPPVIAREDKSFDTPVHVLSRDPARLLPLLEHGFVKGLTITPEAPPALHHAGLFSLWVRALLAMDCQGCALPAVRPRGDQVLSGGNPGASAR